MRAFTQVSRVTKPYGTLLRSFGSSSSRKAAIPADIYTKEDYTTEGYLERHYAIYDATPQHGTILYNYGAYSWWLLASVAACSKELYIMDASSVASWVPEIVFFTGVAYALGPVISNLQASEIVLDRRLETEAYEAGQALADVKLKEITALEAQPIALQQFATEYGVALEEQAQAEKRIAQYEHYFSAKASLDAMVSKKALQASAQANIDLDLILAHIDAKFTEAAVVDKSIEEAIAGIDNAMSYGKVASGVVTDYKASAKFKADRDAMLASIAEQQQ